MKNKSKKVEKSNKADPVYVSNSTGVYELRRGKLYDKDGKKTSSREVAKGKDLLKLSDKSGKALKRERGILKVEKTEVKKATTDKKGN